MSSVTNKIEIVAHRKQWRDDFRSIAESLRTGLGALALRIDHIGSTSVPGLAAKDKIDIQVTIADASHFSDIEEALSKLGYTEVATARCDHVPPGGPFENNQWEKRFFRPPADQRPTNLHVRVLGRANQQYAILFRDFLRANLLIADAYAEVKKQLAEHHLDIDSYCDIKDPVCDIIALSARDWANRTGWTPPASDG